MLRGPDIIVKDSTFSYNGNGGIYYDAYFDESDVISKIQFEGKVSSHHNMNYGVDLYLGLMDYASVASTEVTIKGEVDTYFNGQDYLLHGDYFAVEDRGLASSCSDNSHDEVDDEIISCGATITNDKVVLSDDLFCTDRYYDATDDELMQLNAAITLSGPKASIDCKGNTIRQVAAGYFGSQCLKYLDPTSDPFEPSLLRSELKPYCNIYYQAGILLTDGATAVNCNVENFIDGFLVINGGEVQESAASNNQNGITVHDLTGSIETKVSDVCVQDNMRGIYVYNRASANAVTIQDVKVKHNSQFGAYLNGPDITVIDSIFSYNGEIGIIAVVGGQYTTKVRFEGKVSSYQNGGDGIALLPLALGGNLSLKDIEVTIKGDVATFQNEAVGLLTSTASNRILVTVTAKGSFNSCQNRHLDILSNGPSGVHSFIEIEEGTRYICDTIDVRDEVQGLPEPNCVACPLCS